MPCPETWYKLQPILKFVFISTIVAFCVAVIGFSTPVWISGTFTLNVFTHDNKFSGVATFNHLGLWHACGSDVGCISITRDMPAFFIATRVFACFSIIAAFVASALVFWVMCGKSSGRLLVVSMMLSFVTAGLTVITVCIWGGKDIYKYNLSFSFAMMCIADILYFVNGLLIACYIGTGRR